VFFQTFQKTSRVLALVFAASLPCALVAQVVPSQSKGDPNAPTPHWNVFVGYSLLDPRGTFYPIQPDGTVLPVSFKIENEGLIESAAWFFGRHVGVEVESGQHDLFKNSGFASTGGSNSGIFTLESGLVYRWPGVHLTPFVHGIGGGADIDGPDHEPYTWGPIIGGGGGLDWYFGCHNFGLRVFQADYEYLHANSGLSHGTIAAGNFVWADDENINAIRLSAGLVYRGSSYFGPIPGCGPIPPPNQACVATPNLVYQGEPVTVTATATGLNPRQTATYTWIGPGISSSGEVLSVPTASLAPGTYTVRATVTEGTKSVQSAQCEASFAVKGFEPPTCDMSPMSLSTVSPDQTSTFSINGRSPQNLPLVYSCNPSAGTVLLSGTTGTFSPSGAPEGPVTINCIVKDDKGQTASCKASLVIKAPPVPHIDIHIEPLCPIDFSRDKIRPLRVDNEAKACLDKVALALEQNPSDTLLVVGEAAISSGEGDGDGAQRAVNTKNYLATEKGIDPARITVVIGKEGTKGVEEYLVPPSAVYTSDLPGTTPVDENVVKPQERIPLNLRHHAAPKPAPAKAAPAKKVHAKPVPAQQASPKQAPAKPAPAKQAPAKAAPPKPAPVQTVPAKTAPVKAVPAKQQPTKAAANKAKPVQPAKKNSDVATTGKPSAGKPSNGP